MADSRRSEDVYGEKIDRCIYNSVVKIVGGVGVGIVFSVLLLRRKPWPLILGGGVGIGMGLSDCNYEFKHSRPGAPDTQRNQALEKLMSWRRELMGEKSDSSELQEKLLTDGGKKLPWSDKSHGKGEASDKKSEKARQPIWSKPFPSVSENYDKRNTKD